MKFSFRQRANQLCSSAKASKNPTETYCYVKIQSMHPVQEPFVHAKDLLRNEYSL